MTKLSKITRHQEKKVKSRQFFSIASVNMIALKQSEVPSAATLQNPTLSYPWVKGIHDEALASVFPLKW